MSVAPAPWGERIGWAMIGIAGAGLLALLAHHIIEYLRKRRIRKLSEGVPSKEKLLDLHERIEEIKTKLEPDSLKFEDTEIKVNYYTFHKIMEIVVIFVKMKISIQMTPKYQGLVRYENYNFYYA